MAGKISAFDYAENIKYRDFFVGFPLSSPCFVFTSPHFGHITHQQSASCRDLYSCHIFAEQRKRKWSVEILGIGTLIDTFN